jgi:gamma-glutamyltranspeptidase/glutathione hydrolase
MPAFTTRPEILGTFGVVASTHWLGTATGMAILEKGGNAFDAGAAIGFALQIVEPHLCGPGGDAPIIVRDAKRNKIEVICGQGTSPAAATLAHFQKLGLDLVPGTGLLPAVVPGAFDAWMVLLRDYGTLKLADVLTPAINFARHGYPLVARIPDAIESVRTLFEQEWPASAAIYLKGGQVPQPGTLFRNPDAAATYERVLREAEAASGNREAQIEAARRAWYQGFVADAIDKFCRTNEVMDVSGRRHRGLLTGDDMAKWKASVEAPVTYDYGRYTVCKCGPWSQGPVLLQQLALLKGMGLDGSDPLSPDFVHNVVETAKLAFADREAFYGDPNFMRAPLEILLSDAYNDERRRLVGRDASMVLRPGQVPGHGGPVDQRAAERLRLKDGVPGVLGGPSARAGAGEPTVALAGAGEPTAGQRSAVAGDTVHFDVIDRHGNMISATPSGGWFQSSPVIPELGFCLGTRGQMFWLFEGHPASLQPNKRPRTTLTPSMALRDGEPYIAFGTPGGDQQDQWSSLFFLRHAHHGMNLQEAIDCPAFHTEHFPSSFWPRAARPGVVVVEGRMPEKTVKELRRRGHEVEIGGDWSEGRLSAAARDGDLLKAAANPRGMQGYAIGR